MASAAKRAAEVKKRALAEKHRARREKLKRVLQNPASSTTEREHAQRALQAIPRNANPTRQRNRCALTGRARGYYRKFGLSRIALRELARRGQLPGVTKASW